MLQVDTHSTEVTPALLKDMVWHKPREHVEGDSALQSESRHIDYRPVGGAQRLSVLPWQFMSSLQRLGTPCTTAGRQYALRMKARSVQRPFPQCILRLPNCST